MSVMRIIQRVGAIAGVAAAIVMAIEPRARPAGEGLVVPVAIAVVAGVVGGLIVRYFVPLDDRLKLMHRLSPRTARRLLPPHDDSARPDD